MRFAAFSYGYLLGVVPVLLALYLYGFTRKRQALAMFLEPVLASRLVPGLSHWRQRLKAFCLIGAAGCLALALMQPQWGIRWQDMPSQGRHLMLALDVSRSMLAEDVPPNRLEYAKAAIRELVRVLQKEGGHRLGLVLFAGRADLHCPLTRDYAVFLQRLNDVGPNTVLPGGTAIGHAIQQALQSFPSVNHPHKDLLLLTDGEDHHSLPLEAAQTAAARQVSLYILGLGDVETGSPIPVQDTQGRRTYLQYQGQEVRSRLDTHLLLEMARLTGGAYVRADAQATALARLYTEHIAPKARQHVDTTASAYLVHRYPWFVGVALLLLAAEMLLRERSVRAAG